MPTRFHVKDGDETLGIFTTFGEAETERRRLGGSAYKKSGDLQVIRVGSPDHRPSLLEDSIFHRTTKESEVT